MRCGHQVAEDDAGIDGTDAVPFQTLVDDLFLSGDFCADRGLVKVNHDGDEYRRLRNPRLAARDLGDARAPHRVAHDHQRDLLAVDRVRAALRGRDDFLQYLVVDRFAGIAAVAAVGLHDADGFVHGVYSCKCIALATTA